MATAPANMLWTEALGFTSTNDILVGPICIIVGPRSFLDQL